MWGKMEWGGLMQEYPLKGEGLHNMKIRIQNDIFPFVSNPDVSQCREIVNTQCPFEVIKLFHTSAEYSIHYLQKTTKEKIFTKKSSGLKFLPFETDFHLWRLRANQPEISSWKIVLRKLFKGGKYACLNDHRF